MIEQYGTAFGAPGIDPRWTAGDKDAVGTAYSAHSRVWYTLRRGRLTEIYYPNIDLPQVRDLRLLITDGKTFLDEEGADHLYETKRMCPSLGYELTRESVEQRYTIEKVVIADPHLPCVLQRISVRSKTRDVSQLKLYAVCAPHLGMAGKGNHAYVYKSAGRIVLMAEKDDQYLAMAASVPFARASVGYAGWTDGVTDISRDFTMDWLFSDAPDGNVALTGEIDLGEHAEFTLAVAFGESRHCALTRLFQSLAEPFHKQSSKFVTQWREAVTSRRELESHSSDEGNLYRSSFSLLLAHEDKVYAGAQVASLSIPWGEARNDEDGVGGYHLVWPRDLMQCGTALLAAGNTATPLRTLIYLAVAQLPDGGFPQNFWINGNAKADGTQLDEVAAPILLARRLHIEGACQAFDPGSMVRRAARYMLLHGPVTGQERWEEQAGYSPSTLAAVIAACICAASFATEAGDTADADLLCGYADWLQAHIEDWTVTKKGSVLPGTPRHFVRLNPLDPGKAARRGDVDTATIKLSSQPPGEDGKFPARDIVDAGFLELVRHGILPADDSLIVDSLKVVDAALKRQTPLGAAWLRYNHDGYGQRDDGSAYDKFGVGRAWPLLAGERGHYALAAGKKTAEAIRDLERFGGPTGLLPEQVWDRPDLPSADLCCGGPTGSARPLLWAHAEYIKLLRSVADGRIYDRFPEVEKRYSKPASRRPLEYWTFQHRTPEIRAGSSLRVVAEAPFRLRVTADQWTTAAEHETSQACGVHFADFPIGADVRGAVQFTMYWPDADRWEGRDFSVEVVAPAAKD